jgi:nicotinamidase-related amidase
MEIYRKYHLLGLAAMNDFRIVPRATALVIVDMQYASTHPNYGFQRLYRSLGMGDETAYFQQRLRTTVIPNIQALLAAFRQARLPIVYLTIGSEREDYGDFCARRLRRIAFWRNQDIEIAYARMGTPDWQIIEELAPQSGDVIVNKTTASAFNGSHVDGRLRDLGLDVLVFTGVGTNYCVEMTFRDASDRGYQCILTEDACATSTPGMHERAVDTMSFYGRVLSTREVIEEVTAEVASGLAPGSRTD